MPHTPSLAPADAHGQVETGPVARHALADAKAAIDAGTRTAMERALHHGAIAAPSLLAAEVRREAAKGGGQVTGSIQITVVLRTHCPITPTSM